MEHDKDIQIIHFYGCYYIANRTINEYLLLNINSKKLSVIDELQFNIISLLAEIKNDLKDLN